MHQISHFTQPVYTVFVSYLNLLNSALDWYNLSRTLSHDCLCTLLCQTTFSRSDNWASIIVIWFLHREKHQIAVAFKMALKFKLMQVMQDIVGQYFLSQFNKSSIIYFWCLWVQQISNNSLLIFSKSNKSAIIYFQKVNYCWFISS